MGKRSRLLKLLERGRTCSIQRLSLKNRTTKLWEWRQPQDRFMFTRQAQPAWMEWVQIKELTTNMKAMWIIQVWGQPKRCLRQYNCLFRVTISHIYLLVRSAPIFPSPKACRQDKWITWRLSLVGKSRRSWARKIYLKFCIRCNLWARLKRPLFNGRSTTHAALSKRLRRTKTS